MNRDREAESINRAFWDEIAPIHGRSYDTSRLIAGGHRLDRVQVGEIGDIRGRKVLHLQCHIGTDTLSLARLGADVTGVDFSGGSLAVAADLAKRTGLSARFIKCPIYDLHDHLNERFDLVYTSVGVLCWNSDIRLWAGTIAEFLKPGGRFYIMESHPFLNVFDDEAEGLVVANPYFTGGRPRDWPAGSPDYSDESYLVQSPTREFTWTIGDVHNALVDAGLRISWIHEFNFIHWKALESMEPCEDGFWRLPEPLDRIPLLFSLMAEKPV